MRTVINDDTEVVIDSSPLTGELITRIQTRARRSETPSAQKARRKTPSPQHVKAQRVKASKRNAASRQRRKEERIAAGLCYACGKRPPEEEGKLCQPCLDAEWERKQSKKKKKKLKTNA